MIWISRGNDLWLEQRDKAKVEKKSDVLVISIKPRKDWIELELEEDDKAKRNIWRAFTKASTELNKALMEK